MEFWTNSLFHAIIYIIYLVISKSEYYSRQISFWSEPWALIIIENSIRYIALLSLYYFDYLYYFEVLYSKCIIERVLILSFICLLFLGTQWFVISWAPVHIVFQYWLNIHRKEIVLQIWKIRLNLWISQKIHFACGIWVITDSWNNVG